MNIEIIGIGCTPPSKEKLIQAFAERTSMSPQNEGNLMTSIGDAIMGMKKRGTTSCSMQNLRQVTSFRNLTCTVSELNEEFERVAKKVCSSMRFGINRD
jgi:hypothetical protein